MPSEIASPRLCVPQHIWLRDRINLGIVHPFPFTGARVEGVHDAVVHRLVDRVVPHQGRAFGAAAAATCCHERRRPGQSQLADVGLVDLFQLTVALFRLAMAVREPGARHRIFGGTGRLENLSVYSTRLLGGDGRNQTDTGDDAGGQQGLEGRGGQAVIPSKAV